MCLGGCGSERGAIPLADPAAVDDWVIAIALHACMNIPAGGQLASALIKALADLESLV